MKKWVKQKHDRTNQHFLGSNQQTERSLQLCLLLFPYIYHALPDLVCAVDGEVTRAMEAEREEGN